MLHLTTPRLILKPHTLANVSKMHQWENDAELVYYSDCPPPDREPETVAQIEQYVERIIAGKPGIIYYAIHQKEPEQFIGYGMIAYIDSYNGSCRMGIVLGERDVWGQGFGKEALTAVINYCFHDLGLHRIGVEIYAMNGRSIRLFESLGFQREGVVREAVLKDGVYVDEYIYGLLKKEWPS